jgi:hypothetical protein
LDRVRLHGGRTYGIGRRFKIKTDASREAFVKLASKQRQDHDAERQRHDDF